jgi:hypothetical protein
MRLVLAQEQTGVVATEAEAIRDDTIDLDLACNMGNVVEIAIRVRVVEVDRWGQNAAVYRKCRRDQLDSSRGSEHVAQLALGARNHEVPGVRAENRLERASLGAIAKLGAGAMGVDVLHSAARALKGTAQIAVEISFKDGAADPDLLRLLVRVFGSV